VGFLEITLLVHVLLAVSGWGGLTAPGRAGTAVPGEEGSVVLGAVGLGPPERTSSGGDMSAAQGEPTSGPIIRAGPVGDYPTITELRVGRGGDFATITEALSHAPEGSRVVVAPGVYREPTLVVDRPLEIVGEGWPVLDGEGEREILRVTAHGVTVRGLVLRNVGVSYTEDRAALRVEGVGGCLIQDNRVENAFFGIYLARAYDCRILDNEIQGEAVRETASGNGIHLWYSRHILVQGNRISGHRDGIYFEFVEDSRIRDNLSRDNLRYGLHFMFSDRCRYEGNTFVDNQAGVAVMYTKRVVMVDNLFQDNWGSASFGLLLKDITDSEVRGNRFVRNTTALVADGAVRVQVEENQFRANGWAVRILANSLENEFTGNDFIGNTFDVATNSRRAYSTFRGNFWDRYRGYDLDRDGVGDVPFYPVRLFSLLVERDRPAILLLRSFFVDLLDTAERVLPALTPESLVDEAPRMKAVGAAGASGDGSQRSPGSREARHPRVGAWARHPRVGAKARHPRVGAANPEGTRVTDPGTGSRRP
jgi:nitrous oxidase accessory protein